MRTVKITVGLTVTAELTVYEVNGARCGDGDLQAAAHEQVRDLADDLVDAMRNTALRAAERSGLLVSSYTTQAIETQKS